MYQVILKLKDGREIRSMKLDKKPLATDDVVVKGMRLYEADDYEIVKVRKEVE